MGESTNTHSGHCFCGEVEFTVTGEPKAAGYCHCASCRAWAAAPLNGFTLWDPASLRVTKGKQNIGEYHASAKSHRMFCKTCGGHLFTEHPPMHLVDVYSALIPSMKFEPKLHVHYQEHVMDVHDGLPKLRDMPKEMGGSGEMMAE